MEYIHGTEDFKLERSSAVTLGKFDGVHLGHQKLISIVKEKAEEQGLLSVMFTFDRIPLSICPQKNQHFLSTNSERRMLCENYGIDVEVEYPFTTTLMNMEPEEFVSDILINKLKAKVIVVGTDYCFGRDRSGNVEFLISNAAKYGYETIVVEKEKFQDKDISSTYVREELKLGHMETVNVLLNRPYSITGIVAKGNQLGRKLASRILIDGVWYYGVTNLGTKPTISDGYEVSVETNVFDFDKDVYGNRVEVALYHFLRQEMKFENVEALKKQMESDASFAKEMFLIQ